MVNKLNDFANVIDIELMLMVKEDNIDAFEELVNRYKNRIINFVFRYVDDYHLSEDITQETFVRLYQSRKRYVPLANLSTYIYTIALNLAKTELKKRNRWKMISLSISKDDGEEFVREFFFAHSDTEKEISGTFTREEVLKALSSIGEQFKQAVILRDMQNLSYDEISDILKVPKGTVKSRINRGRLQLRRKLTRLNKINRSC
jgi:RNA polymerase sigma-70 factor (ECF subfamily)